MTAKEYLQQVKTKGIVIENLRRDKERIMQMLYSMGGGTYGERVQTSRNIDKFGTLYGCIEEKQQEIDKKMCELIEFEWKVSNEINELKNEKHIKALYHKYMLFQSWDEMAEVLECSRRSAIRIHRNAITAFQNKYAGMLEEIESEEEDEY